MYHQTRKAITMDPAASTGGAYFNQPSQKETSYGHLETKYDTVVIDHKIDPSKASNIKESGPFKRHIRQENEMAP